jgi:ketosteroid isomerase-like protein
VSQENVEVVRHIYATWDLSVAGSLTEATMRRAFGSIDPGIEWRGPREFPDLAEPHFGHDGIVSYAAKLAEAFEHYRMIPEQFIDPGGERVLVLSRETGRGKGSGAKVQTHLTAHLWTVRNGRAARFESYWEREEALKAAGLAEPGMAENLDLVRSIYARWELGDFRDTGWADPALEVVWPDGPVTGTWSGLAECEAGWREFLESWEDYRVAAEQYRARHDLVLALVTYTARGRTSGLEVGLSGATGASLFHLRNGRVIRLVLYWDRERALADLGLEG